MADTTPDPPEPDQPSPPPTVPPTEPPHPDPPPAVNRGGRPKGSKNKTTRARPSRAAGATGEPSVSVVDRKLTASLTYMLLQPASISREVGFPFGVVHFSNSAKPTAEMIVKASHDFDELRTILTSADKMVSGKVLFAAAIAGYLVPALLALRDLEGPAYMLGRATPDEVAAAALVMPGGELRDLVQQMRGAGLSDDQIAARPRTTMPQVPRSRSFHRGAALLSRPATRRPSESQALDGVTVKERNNPELVQLPDNWMPWHQFKPWFAKEWQPGDHVAIVGMTGSGKTTFARQILKLRGYTVVFATKAKDDSLYKPLERMGFVIRDEWDPGAWEETGERYVIFRPMRPGERPTRDVLERQAESFREALLDVFVVGGWCCYFDEVRYLADDLGLARELNVLWLQGRSLNIRWSPPHSAR